MVSAGLGWKKKIVKDDGPSDGLLNPHQGNAMGKKRKRKENACR